MKGGKTIAFILPFDKSMASIHVRAKCLMEFAPHGWTFEFIEGSYPAIVNFPVIRRLYRYLYYLIPLLSLKLRRRNPVALIIKSSSFILILIIRYLLKIKVISDVNDAIHLPQSNGYFNTLMMLRFSNYIIFESPEYEEFWRNKKITLSSTIEDTPQFECVFLDYINRPKQVVWVGSPDTSKVLLEYIPHLKLFIKYGFEIKLLGPSSSVVQKLTASQVDVLPIYRYDNITMIAELTSAAISFVPMPNSDLYNLRGNLKAKISMACGCLTIASKNKMHCRLIEDKKTGYLFNSYEDLNEILKCISKDVPRSSSIAFDGNVYVATNFTRADHAQKIVRIANEIYQ